MHKPLDNNLKMKKRLNRYQTAFIIVGVFFPIFSFLVFWIPTNISSLLMSFKTTLNGQVVYNLDNFRMLIDEFKNPFSQIGHTILPSGIKRPQDIHTLACSSFGFAIVCFLLSVSTANDHRGWFAEFCPLRIKIRWPPIYPYCFVWVPAKNVHTVPA